MSYITTIKSLTPNEIALVNEALEKVVNKSMSSAEVIYTYPAKIARVALTEAGIL